MKWLRFAIPVLAALPLCGQDSDTRVAALLKQRCLSCHNNQLKNADISFEDRDSLIRTHAVVPGDPAASRLIKAVQYADDIKMPPGTKLPAQDIATLTAWIRQGAGWGTALQAAVQPSAKQYPFERWNFDRLDQIGGYPTKVEGHPRVVDTPAGKAVEFNGADDALFIDDHPLAGAETFTWEVIFRPDPTGKPEQRFFHLQERDPNTGQDTLNRFLFEIRVTGDSWYLDAFANSSTGSKALMNVDHPHKLGPWYHVAMVYDGHQFRNYVNGVKENSFELKLSPQLPGHASAGTRINRRDYFKGMISVVRFTRGPLSPDDFLKLPVGLP